MPKFSCGMIRVTDTLHVSLFSFVALFFFVMSQGIFYSLIFILSAFLHELSHLYCLYRFGAKIRKVTIFPFGIDILADTSSVNYKKELICSLSGCFTNLSLSLLGAFLLEIQPSPIALFFTLCNIQCAHLLVSFFLLWYQMRFWLN